MNLLERLILINQLSITSSQDATGELQNLLTEIQNLRQEDPAIATTALAQSAQTDAALMLFQAATQGLTSKELSERLGVSNYLLSQRRRQLTAAELSEWIREQDPQNLTWEYREGRYFLKLT